MIYNENNLMNGFENEERARAEDHFLHIDGPFVDSIELHKINRSYESLCNRIVPCLYCSTVRSPTLYSLCIQMLVYLFVNNLSFHFHSLHHPKTPMF